jgi:hypothetical protein
MRTKTLATRLRTFYENHSNDDPMELRNHSVLAIIRALDRGAKAEAQLADVKRAAKSGREA